MASACVLTLWLCESLSGIKIPENCVARVREELLQMDEEVKKKRREREQLALEQRALEQREMENRHLLANLFNQKPILNKSLVQSLAPNQFLKQKPSQSVPQRTQSGSVPQLSRVQPLPESTLQQPPQTMPMQPLQRNPCQGQQRTHNSWSTIPTTSTNHHVPLSNPANHASSLQPQFHPQQILSFFQQQKNPGLPFHPNASSSNPLDEILDLTVSSPSPSPDTTEGGPSLDSLTRHSSAFGEDFNLESLMALPAPNPQPATQLQQPLLLQQQQNRNMLANIQQGLLDFFDLSMCPQMSSQNPNPSSSNSSGSSSTSPVSNSLVSQVPAGQPPSSSLTSSSSSLFSSPSSSSSLFSNSFSSPYIHPQSDPLHLPNGHCSTNALDVREALNSMLQDGHDRKSVIQYRHQD